MSPTWNRIACRVAPRLACCLANGLLIALPLLAARAVEPPAAVAGAEEVLRDEWSVHRLLGAEIGYMHMVVERVVVDGTPMLRATSETRIAMKRFGQEVAISVSTKSLETGDGVLVSAQTRNQLTGTETFTEMRVDGDRLLVKETVYGREREREVEWSPDILGHAGARLMTERHLDQPGARYEYRTFYPDLGAQAITVKGHVVGPVTREIEGRQRRVIEVEEQVSAFPGMTVRSWYEPNGAFVASHSPLAGGMAVVRVPRERALAGPDTDSDREFDALLSLSATSNVALRRPYAIESARYRVTFREGDPAELAPALESARQKVVERDGKRVVLDVRALVPDDGSHPIERDWPEEIRPYLEPNAWLQCDDPDLARAAREAIGDETDAWKAAKKLERWVYEKIEDKNMSVGFASASEVFDRPEGDCSEHAVLLAAALRAVGIPSRVTMGVLYFETPGSSDEDPGKFGGHAWTEAYLGEWVPLDATLARPFVSAVHLEFGRSSLGSESLEELFGSLVITLGNVDVDVLRYTQEGRTVHVEP